MESSGSVSAVLLLAVCVGWGRDTSSARASSNTWYLTANAVSGRGGPRRNMVLNRKLKYLLPLGYLFASCLLLPPPLTVRASFSASTLFPDCSCTLQCICVTVLLLFFYQLLSWVTSYIYLPPCGSSLVISPLCCCFWAPVSLFWMKIL